MAHLLSSGIYGFLCSSLKKGNKYVSSFVAGLSGWFISHDGNAEFEDTLIRKFLSSPLFVPGFDGSGMKIYKDNGDWKAEFDKLSVRKSMTVYELIIEKIRSVNGAIVVSPANGKIKGFTLEQGKYTIELEDTNSFVVHDLVRCQHWTGKDIKYYWVEVESVNENSIVVPEFEFEGVKPAIGDELVQMGNTVNKDRQGAVFISAGEDGLPRVDVLSGIHSKTLEGCVKTRLGCLEGIHDPDFPLDAQPKGYGLYCENGFFKGDVYGGDSFCLRKDKSGYLAGGAIKWHYSDVKKKWLLEMGDVILTWNNLSDQVKENLKGKDAVTYELRPSVSSINVDQNGVPKEKFITVELYKTVGNGTPQLCKDPCSIYYTVYIGDQSAGTSSVSNSVQIQTYLEQGEKVVPIDKVIIGANIDNKPVCTLTITCLNDGFTSDWLLDWHKNRTMIAGEEIASPKMFSGTRDQSTGKLTGIFSGRDCLKIKGVSHTGIFAVVDDEIVFSLDPLTKKYLFKGRVEADEGIFKGNLSTPFVILTSDMIDIIGDKNMLNLEKSGFNINNSSFRNTYIYFPYQSRYNGTHVHIYNMVDTALYISGNTLHNGSVNFNSFSVAPYTYAEFRCALLHNALTNLSKEELIDRGMDENGYLPVWIQVI